MENETLMNNKNEETNENIMNTMQKLLKGVAWILVILFVVGAIIFNISFTVNKVTGTSMNPTLANNDRIVMQDQVNELGYEDIVSVDASFAEGREGTFYIKRVIGLPGDTIEIRNNQLYRNDELVQEDYIKDPMNWNPDQKVVLGEDEVWVMGDHRNHSTDSRTFGAVPMTNVTGKAILIAFPFNAIGALN